MSWLSVPRGCAVNAVDVGLCWPWKVHTNATVTALYVCVGGGRWWWWWWWWLGAVSGETVWSRRSLPSGAEQLQKWKNDVSANYTNFMNIVVPQVCEKFDKSPIAMFVLAPSSASASPVSCARKRSLNDCSSQVVVTAYYYVDFLCMVVWQT